jgi:tRNA-2-methylthio-N6-dimethylallyladenosine synthase
MGCQMNEYDSDYLGQLLMSSDLCPTDDPRRANLILINTCTVRAKAEQKAYSQLGRMLNLKRRNPGLILGIMGCIAQQEGEKLLKRFPALDMVLGTREIGRIPELLERIETTQERVVATEIDTGLKPPPPLAGHTYFRGRVKGYVSIMEGCNNFCSYCIVPHVRGREISRPLNDILEEAKSLIAQGVREITLLGQNVNSYRMAGENISAFPHLLERLNSLEGLIRVRFTTSHPKDLSDDVIRCFKDFPKLCPHLHLPVQAGSNTILKAMSRGYTREHYMALVARLRDVRPDVALTSDVIVGFPGETEKDYELTLDLIRKMEFDMIFSFKYSDRKGTPAAGLENKIDEKIKSSRLSVIQEIQRGITSAKNKALEGRQMEILVEGPSRRDGQLMGRTGTNKIVNFKSKNVVLGELINVEIKRAYVNSLWAEPL